MKNTTVGITALLAAWLLASCTPLAKVTVTPAQRPGFDTQTSTPLADLERYVGAAESAWHKLQRNPADTNAQGDYNFAVSRIVGTLSKSKLAPWKAPVQLASHTLSWKQEPDQKWAPGTFEFIPTDQLKISGKYMSTRELKQGVGAPLVAKRSADQAHELAPTPHFYYTATAIARFTGTRCVISVNEPMKEETVRLGNHNYPLAADFTAPLAMTLVEMEPVDLGLARLLRPAEYAATTRIARLEPYDPEKTVVLVVHGLGSSPSTWFPMLNQLRANRGIRDHYQFWFYSYPSGYPYPYSAATLRKELDHAEKIYPMRKKMVVMGHSMGGCISRLLVTDSKQRIWNQMFTVPPAKMEISEDHKHILTESAIFEHRPEIGRVIFISTPHRGSDLATDFLGRTFINLVKLPTTLASIATEEARYEKRAPGEQHLDHFPNSVDTLAPDNSFVVALNPIPITPGIPHHTIAGDRGRGDSPDSSDGVVPYWSSHQQSAKSELIVPSHHGAHQTDEAVAEVERILTEHLAESN